MQTIESIRDKARSFLKTIVLPEIEDPRIREAARFIQREGIAKVILLDRDKMPAAEKEKYANDFFQLRQSKGLSFEEAKNILDEPLYYAAMMTREGKVDGFVAGAAHTTPDVARAAIQCLGVDESLGLALSCFVMVVPDCPYGEGGTFIFADCGIVPEPNPRQLACIAVASAEFAAEVLDFNPRVAFLTYSTKGSAKGKFMERIQEALSLVKTIKPDLLIDGELQVDAAIVPQVAEIKYADSPLKGRGNILIFPNLEAGNIGYKLVQRLAKARALGPLLLGLNSPCSDLSRGCSVEDIVDCVAITAIRAQKK